MIIYSPKYLQEIAHKSPLTERALTNIMRQAYNAAQEGYGGVSDYWNNSVHKINSKSQREYIKSVLITMGYTNVKIKKSSFTISWGKKYDRIRRTESVLREKQYTLRLLGK